MMGVSLERVQFKFASIIGELCSEPRVLSQFAVWLDLRLAEYKLKGSISLECSNAKPDPTWLNGIKDEDEPYIVSINKVRRLSQLESSTNTRAQGQFPEEVLVDPSGFQEQNRLKLPATENLTLDICKRLSPNASIKEDVNEIQPTCILPVNLSQYDNHQSSVNRRKRQSSTIIRNSSLPSSSRTDFRSPYASEDESLSDRFYSTNQSQTSFLNPTSGGLFETSTSQSISIPDEGIKPEMTVEGIKHEISVGDEIMTTPECQSEPVLPPEGDSQYPYSKGENSEISPGDSRLGPFGGMEEQEWRRKYARTHRAVSETPEQKKIRMRELAKMRQRRCRERQKLRRLIINSSSYLMPKGVDPSVDQIVAHEFTKDSSTNDVPELTAAPHSLHARPHESLTQTNDVEQIQDSCHQIQPLNLNLHQASQHTVHVPQSSA